jgi:RNA polymerase sigma factor (sigma-70 family)
VDSGDPSGLVRAAASGDEAAWAALVERFSGLVWSVARAHGLSNADAEEVFQTTWLRVTEHVGRLKEPDRVGAWLATTARNESLKTIRAGQRATPTDDLETWDVVSPDATPETLAVASEEATAEADRLRRVWDAFQRLPERCRELLRMLVAVPPLPYIEIAALLGIAVLPDRLSDSRLDRIRRWLLWSILLAYVAPWALAAALDTRMFTLLRSGQLSPQVLFGWWIPAFVIGTNLATRLPDRLERTLQRLRDRGVLRLPTATS